MEVTGKIKVISEEQSFGAGGFRKRDAVITTSEQYPQDLSIEFLQDKCDLLDKYKVGDTVKIGINLRGREWINPEGVAKYFNSIVGWRIDTEVAELAPLDDNPAVAVKDDLPF